MKGWRGPAYPGEFPTLGFTVLDWSHAYLPSPADETQPLVFTNQQARFILAWYRIDPLTGRFNYRRAAIEEAKGYGKSPEVGALMLVEFAGPCLFDGWDANGDPVAKPWGIADSPPPWVQIAAVSEDQTDNTYRAILGMLTANDHKAAQELRIDSGKTRLELIDRRGWLEPVTASAGSREGQRITAACLDETHLWTPRNGGRKLAATLRRNVGKMNGRTIETTNAPTLGEKSVAEETGDAAKKAADILHVAHRPSVEPQPDWTDEQLMEALREVYHDAPWVDLPRILAEIRDPDTDWPDALRFNFNTRTTGAGKAVDPRVWDALAKPRDVPAGTPIGLGFDGSMSRDATGLIGCTADGYSFVVDAWIRPTSAAEFEAWKANHPGFTDWQVIHTEVDAAIDLAFATWNVGLLLADPPKWQDDLERWALRYPERVVTFETFQYRKMAKAVDRWRTAIREGTHTHAGDPRLDAHVKAANLLKVRLQDDEDDQRTKYVIVKGEDRRLIDLAVADVLAYEAAMTMPEMTPVEFFPF